MMVGELKERGADRRCRHVASRVHPPALHNRPERVQTGKEFARGMLAAVLQQGGEVRK